MKFYEVIILLHIRQYGRIDFLILESELHIPRAVISKIVKKLHDNEIIRVQENQVYISKINNVLVKDTSWYSPQPTNIHTPIFEWDYLYIPKKFNII
ncbi:MAG: hypothetical protein AB2417_09925 [Clostridiaceae bacterium]